MSNKFIGKLAANVSAAALAIIMSAGIAAAADTGVAVNEVNFPDSGFRAYVEQTIDTDGSKSLSAEEIAKTTYINVRSRGIKNLKGIETFTSLKTLNCGGNELASIDVKANTQMESLDASNNKLTSLDVSANKSLRTLSVDGNMMQSINLDYNPALETLDVSKNELMSMDITKCTRLVSLSASNNQLASIDMSKNGQLATVNLAGNRLTSIDVSANTLVSTLNISDNKIVLLDVSANSALLYLDCSYNSLIDVKAPAGIVTITANNNNIADLDVKAMEGLKSLNVADNSLYNLDVQSNKALENLDVSGNHLAALDITNNTALKKENVNASRNKREIYVNQTNEAELEGTYIDIEKIVKISTADAATGQAFTIGKDGKVPEKVNYTYELGNEAQADFEVVPVMNKKILAKNNTINIYLFKNGTQPEYPLSVIALGGAADVKWSSTDSNIVTVNENGGIIPKAIGQTTVIAAAYGFDSARITVNVLGESENVTVGAIDNQYYTGAEVKPEPVVKIGDKVLVKGTDYTVSYQNNVNVGTAYVLVRGTGRYSFSVSKKFNICYNIANMVSDAIGDQLYTGGEIRPGVVLKNGSYVLVKDVDYTLSYSNNIALGTAIVTITGKGDYAGVKIQSFNIVVPQVTNLVVSKFYAKKLTLSWTPIAGVTGYRIYKYNPTTKKYAFLKQLNGSATNTYTDEKLTQGTQYRYRVRAFIKVNDKNVYGKYSTKLKTYTKPKKVTLKAKAGTRKATLTWSKVTGATGYRVYMKKSGSSKFSKIKQITKGSTVSYTKTKLTKGKTYYFKVRAFRTVNGKKIYGAYSKIKTVIVK
ncbi:MAG: hypothetical protein HFH14_07270 [Lachnospiraceae bacterium]|nr:hypothetical protein [Lachnospiraceae bacterium]